jgi:hypothetical protein
VPFEHGGMQTIVDLPKPPTHIGYKAFLGGALELEVKTCTKTSTRKMDFKYYGKIMQTLDVLKFTSHESSLIHGTY